MKRIQYYTQVKLNERKRKGIAESKKVYFFHPVSFLFRLISLRHLFFCLNAFFRSVTFRCILFFFSFVVLIAFQYVIFSAGLFRSFSIDIVSVSEAVGEINDLKFNWRFMLMYSGSLPPSL